MHLSQTIEYALRAVVWLAENPGTPQTTQQIADACKAPASYLAKVLQGLVRNRIITAQRGPGGGFALERDPVALTLLEVVNAVEPVQRVAGCPLGIESHAEELCPLHKVLDQAILACQQVLAGHRIQELAHRGCFVRSSSGESAPVPVTVAALAAAARVSKSS
jgi:Rrf2 family protein